MSGANASPTGRSHQLMSGANASPTGRSHQLMSGANASPTGRSHQLMTEHDFSFSNISYVEDCARSQTAPTAVRMRLAQNPPSGLLLGQKRNQDGLGDDVEPALLLDENCRRFTIHALGDVGQRRIFG